MIKRHLPNLRGLHDYKRFPFFFLTIILVFRLFPASSQQKTTFSIAADPHISWFTSDNRYIETNGIKPGISFGLVVDRFFGEKYAFSTGLFMTHLGGNLSYSDTVQIGTSIDTVTVPAGTILSYRLQYISIPLALKLKTVEIGYKTFFVELGLKAMIRINSKASAPNNLLVKDKISDEIALFNLAYSFGGGMEFSLGENTSIIGGLYYTNTFLDITKDLYNKPKDYLRASMMSLRVGVLF